MKLYGFIGFIAILSGIIASGCGGGGGSSSSGIGGRIYIADGNDRIVRVDDMTGKNWKTFGSTGSGVNQFSFPSDVAFDSQGRIYVSDWSNDRIVRFDNMNGDGWTTFGTGGTGVGQFNHPYKLAFDDQDRIYILDSDNSRVVRIDDMSGANWVEFGSAGTGALQFQGMASLAVDSQNRIYVGDYALDRIARVDDMTGANWTTFGSNGVGVGQFESPGDIVFDANDNMLIADRGGRVIYTSNMSTTGWASFNLSYAQSACFDKSGKIYVVDQDAEILSRVDGISGAGLVTLGTSGSGVNQFDSPSAVRIAK